MQRPRPPHAPHSCTKLPALARPAAGKISFLRPLAAVRHVAWCHRPAVRELLACRAARGSLVLLPKPQLPAALIAKEEKEEEAEMGKERGDSNLQNTTCSVQVRAAGGRAGGAAGNCSTRSSLVSC